MIEIHVIGATDNAAESEELLQRQVRIDSSVETAKIINFYLLKRVSFFLRKFKKNREKILSKVALNISK